MLVRALLLTRIVHVSYKGWLKGGHIVWHRSELFGGDELFPEPDFGESVFEKPLCHLAGNLEELQRSESVDFGCAWIWIKHVSISLCCEM